jgi:hypothetical protein
MLRCRQAKARAQLAYAVFPEVQLRGFTGDVAEVFVKAGEVVESALEAKLFDADAVVEEQFTGMTDPDLGKELGVGFAGAGFEIAAERIGYQACYTGYLIEVDLLRKMAECVIIDGIDPVIFRFGKIGPEANGRQELQPVRAGEGGQAFDQGDDPADPFGVADLFHLGGDFHFIARVDEQSAPGFFQEATDRFGFRQVEEDVAPKILGKVDDGRVNLVVAVLLEKGIVVAPVMRKVRAYQDDITGMKAFDMIADELRAAALVKEDQFHFGMIVPAVIDKGIPVFPDTERVGGRFWDF